MKKIILSAVVVFTTASYAGKNYVPAPSEPIPIPPAVEVPLGFYLGGGLTYSKAECKCNLDQGQSFENGRLPDARKDQTGGFNLKAGYTYNDFIAFEAKYMYTPWKGKAVKHYGLYFKPTYPISENLDVYALLGYGKTECETLPDSYKGFAWGAGAEFTINKKIDGKKDGFGVYIEYVRPLKKTGNKDIKVDMVNAGVSYNF